MDPKEEIRHRLSVDEVVGEYLELKPAGAGSSRALCPFHGEKSPSFYVSKPKQIWHCFGCNKGGDIFSFVMEMEGIEFPDALQILAKKAGVEVPRYQSEKTNKRTRLIEANTLARRYYEKVMIDHDLAKEARAYLEKRGIDASLRESFGIGFAPDAWEALCGALKKRGFQDSELLEAGLALRGKLGGVIDRFRGRIMVPLEDAHGNTVGFTGRVLSGADEKMGPKYMNSPETEAYHKGELLYGLSKAKMAIKKAGAVIIVEGNLDVVASHKAGVEHVVASSGTALTSAQIRLLQRYTSSLVFCFDGDAAGFQAARRGIRLATEMGCDLSVLLIPKALGKDPDEVVQRDPELWRNIVLHPIPIMEYFFTISSETLNVKDVKSKRDVGNFLLEEIALLTDTIEREHWMNQLSDLIHVDLVVLRKTVQGLIAKTPTLTVVAPKTTTTSEIESRSDLTFGILLALFIQFPMIRSFLSEQLETNILPKTEDGRLYELLKEAYTAPQEGHPSQLLPPEISQMLASDESLASTFRHAAMTGERLAEDLQEDRVRSYVQEHLNVFIEESKKRRRYEVEQQLRLAEADGDQDAVATLLRQYRQLN